MCSQYLSQRQAWPASNRPSASLLPYTAFNHVNFEMRLMALKRRRLLLVPINPEATYHAA
jgi:hypothetical protein